MPCYSSIQTKLTNGQRILDAMKALGLQKISASQDLRRVDADGISFAKNGETYSATDNAGRLNDIRRKYAELGAREMLKRRGYTVQSFDGRKITAVQRRGG